MLQRAIHSVFRAVLLILGMPDSIGVGASSCWSGSWSFHPSCAVTPLHRIKDSQSWVTPTDV